MPLVRRKKGHPHKQVRKELPCPPAGSLSDMDCDMGLCSVHKHILSQKSSFGLDSIRENSLTLLTRNRKLGSSFQV